MPRIYSKIIDKCSDCPNSKLFNSRIVCGLTNHFICWAGEEDEIPVPTSCMLDKLKHGQIYITTIN